VVLKTSNQMYHLEGNAIPVGYNAKYGAPRVELIATSIVTTWKYLAQL